MKFKKIITATAISLAAICTVGGLTACPKSTGIVFWHTMGKSLQDKLNALIQDYQEDRAARGLEAVTIEHSQQGSYDDLKAKLLKAIPAKTCPTMAYCYPDHVADYLRSSSVVTLDDFVNDPDIGFSAEDLADLSIYWEEGTSYGDGKCYSVPFMKSTEVVFYNQTAFDWYSKNYNDGVALTVPTKWCTSGVSVENETDLTTMVGLCKLFKEHYGEYYKYRNPTATTSDIEAAVEKFRPLGYDSESNMYITLSEQFGVDYTSINEDKTGNILFAGENNQGTSASRELVKMIYNWYANDLLATANTNSGKTYTSTLFTDEALFMSIGSTGGTTYNFDEGFRINVASIPQQNDAHHAVIQQGPSICFFKTKNVSDQQIKDSWDFYKFLTQSENSAAFSLVSGYEPVRKSSYSDHSYVSYHENALAQEDETSETLISKVAQLTSSEGFTDDFFTSPAFHGSANCRDNVGDLIVQTCLADYSNTTLDDKLNSLYRDMLANIYMGMR